MRMMEMMMLRIEDVNFGRREIAIRFGKGGKDRRTVLPLSPVAPLKQQIDAARILYDADHAAHRMGVMLPDSLPRKYTQAATQ
jgi:integrase